MTTWDAPAHAAVTGPEEVRIVTRRRDGSLRRPRIIWIVPVDDRVFIRSANGRGADGEALRNDIAMVVRRTLSWAW